MVYYNEFEPGKAEWLRELMAAGVIAKGDVDERSIADVQPGDLAGYNQCHFFAGIGIWSYALRLAGWPDDRPIWTASCPCQPFSAAGKRLGKADERHLWPELHRLIRELQPEHTIGEQVAGRDGLGWLDDVFDDLERCAYTCGAVVSPACGYGAPHIRQRMYWCAGLADANRRGSQAGRSVSGSEAGGGRVCDMRPATPERSESVGMAYHGGAGLEERPSLTGDAGRQREATERDCGTDRLEHAAGDGRLERRAEPGERGAIGGCSAGELALAEYRRWWADHGGMGDSERAERGADQRQPGRYGKEAGRLEGPDRAGEPGPVNGFWRGADWVLTRPQRVGDAPSLRPAPPGIFPLANGIAGRVLALRGAGDGIVAHQAAAWIEACAAEWGF